MIRQTVSNLIDNIQFQDKISKVILAFSIFLLIVTPVLFPHMGEPNYISENAIQPDHTHLHFEAAKAYSIMGNLNKLNFLNENSTIQYIEEYFDMYNVPHQRQYFDVYTGLNPKIQKTRGKNLVGIYHSKRTTGGECNLIVFNHDLIRKNGNGKSEIAVALTFLDVLSQNQTNYVSRDLIFLAYDGKYKSYGKAVREFLKQYYLNNKESEILRCGSIRQAVNFEVTSDKFDSFVLSYQGYNGQVPDMDYYMIFQETFSKLGIKYLVEENTQVERKIQDFIYKSIGTTVLDISNELGYNFGKPNLIYTLSSFKNMLLPINIHEAHTHLLDYGIHAVTIKCIENTNILQKDPNNKNLNNIQSLGEVIEHAHRTVMGLEEQIHAGPTQWFLIGHKNHIGIGKYLFPWMPLMITIQVVIVKNFVRVKRRLDFMGYFIDTLAPILVGWTVFLLPKFIESAFSLYNGWNTSFCIEAQLLGSPNDVTDQMTLIFAIGAITIIFVGESLYKFIIKKVFLGGKINNNNSIDHFQESITQDPIMQSYIDNQWRIFLLFPTAYIALGVILWLPINLPFGIFGAYFLIPIWYILKPFSKKFLVYNILTLAVLTFYAWIIYEWYVSTQANWFNILKSLLAQNSICTLNLFVFTCSIVIPWLLLIKQILFFKVKQVS